MDPSSLKKFDLFKDVDESKLNKIAPFTMLVEFPEGKTVIQEGGYSNDFYAIETVAVKATVNLLIPELKRNGAEDILELPISKIVA